MEFRVLGAFLHPAVRRRNAMRTFKLLVPAVLMTVGFFVCTTAYGTPEYAKKEKKSCTFCHSKVAPTDKELMKKSLTDAGKFYSEHKSLDGYTEKK
jgi:hypothetical protein